MKRTLLLLFVLLLGLTAIFAGEPVTGIGAGAFGGLPFHIGAIGEYNFGPAYASLEMGYYLMGFSAFMLRAEGGYNFPTPFINNDWGMDLYLSIGGSLGGYIGPNPYAFFPGDSKVRAEGALGIPVTWSWYADKIPLKVFVKAGPEFHFGGGFT